METTIMIAPETHKRLKVKARESGLYINGFFDWLVMRYAPKEMPGIKLSNCSSCVSVSKSTRDEVKLRAAVCGVTMARYVEGLIDAHCEADILE